MAAARRTACPYIEIIIVLCNIPMAIPRAAESNQEVHVLAMYDTVRLLETGEWMNFFCSAATVPYIAGNVRVSAFQ